MYSENISDELVDLLILYEEGKLSEEDTVAFFQVLIDLGLATRFGGDYQIIAKQLLTSGKCNQERSAA